jgi:hypothetical protein
MIDLEKGAGKKWLFCSARDFKYQNTILYNVKTYISNGI